MGGVGGGSSSAAGNGFVATESFDQGVSPGIGIVLEPTTPFKSHDISSMVA